LFGKQFLLVEIVFDLFLSIFDTLVELLLILAIIWFMKRASIYFLALLTFWMSTWMVTDIHDWSIADSDQPHPVFSIQQTQHVSDSHLATQDHTPHCGVCSYDHGGHMGQTLATSSFVAKSIPAQNIINLSLQSEFWYSRSIAPKLRPPIA